jgi:hypothetical protein
MGSEPPPVSQLSPLAPAALDQLVAACLAKDPADRIQSAHDAKLQLSWITAGGSQAGARAVAGMPSRSRVPLGRAALAVGVVALALGAAAGYFGRARLSPAVAAAGDVRYKAVTFEEGFVFAARFAPDGRTIVYSADWDRRERDLFVTGLDSPDFRPLGFTGSDLLAVSRTGELGTLAPGAGVTHGGARPGRSSRAFGLRTTVPMAAWLSFATACGARRSSTRRGMRSWSSTSCAPTPASGSPTHACRRRESTWRSSIAGIGTP